MPGPLYASYGAIAQLGDRPRCSPPASASVTISEGVTNTGELQLLVNGRNSVLDIKKMLDAQSRTTSDLQAVFNYLEILKAAGLVGM